MSEKRSIVAEKRFQFSLKIVSLYKELIRENEYVMSKQLLRYATSIGANIEEPLAGQTKKDFTAKTSIASKEARETRYWLRLLDKSQFVERNYSQYLKDVEQLINMLTSIVKTSKQNQQ